MGNTPLFDEGVYCVVDNNKLNMSGIQLTKGIWEGLIYTYGKVEFVEVTSAGQIEARPHLLN